MSGKHLKRFSTGSTGQGNEEMWRCGVVSVQYVCCSRKTRHRLWAPLEVSMVSRPLESVAMDILGPLPETPRGSKYILVVGDYFTKWKEVYPLKNMDATSVARAFVNEFVDLVCLSSLHTDQGKNFESAVIKVGEVHQDSAGHAEYGWLAR